MTKMPPDARTPYRGYARNIGLAFQIADDLIDHSGDEAAAGKPTGTDAACRQGDLRLAARRGARAAAGGLPRQPGDRASVGPRQRSRPAARHRPLCDRERSLMGKVAVYPGTFDPITLGHLDIIRRGAHLVDKLVIGVTTNPSKEPMFTVDERLAMVRREVAGHSRQHRRGRVRLAADGLRRDSRARRRSCAACAPSPISNMSSRWPA